MPHRRLHRSAAVAGTAALLALAGPAWPAAGQGGDVRPPGVPPPLTASALPAAEPMPYQAPGQVGPPEQVSECVTRATGSQVNVEEAPAAQRRLRIEGAWAFARGRGQTVAVIDTGVRPHPRLAGRLVQGGDYVLGEPAPRDCDGHGTLVAGIIAAAEDRRTGFAGVAPEARILSIRQSSLFYEVTRVGPDGQQQRDPAGDTTSMARAVRRAADAGATVINISEAACFPARLNEGGHPDLQAAVHYARTVRDAVVVAAAGNAGQDGACQSNNAEGLQTVATPAWYDDDVLTVAAMDSDGEPAEFSVQGPWVDVAAPGTQIVSLDPTGAGLTNVTISPDGEQSDIRGTSFAAPYVAGVVALVRERFPELSAVQVMERIEQTAQHTAGPGGRTDAAGYGMVDPVAALTAVLPGEQGQPVAPVGRLELPPPPVQDPTPTRVALIGTVAGIALLGITVFTVYTVQRVRGHGALPNEQD